MGLNFSLPVYRYGLTQSGGYPTIVNGLAKAGFTVSCAVFVPFLLLPMDFRLFATITARMLTAITASTIISTATMMIDVVMAIVLSDGTGVDGTTVDVASGPTTINE